MKSAFTCLALFLGTAAFAVSAFAQPAPDDMPGKVFTVTPESLPQPYATPAVANRSETVAKPKTAHLSVPKGFEVSLFANVDDARFMAMAPNGDVFVAEPKQNQIMILRDTHNSGAADVHAVFAGGFHYPHGLAFHDGALYVGDLDAVWKVDYTPGALKGGKRTRITTESFGGDHFHISRDIAFGPDGKLYVAIGSGQNIGIDPPTRASVQEVVAGGKLKTFVSGTRNPVGIAFYPGTDDLYITVNERDGLGDGLVPDYFTQIKQGQFYGWPYAYTGPHPQPGWGNKRPDLVAKTVTPEVLFQPHSAPLGLVFYNGSQFPAEYKGRAFVALHGSWNSSKPTGYKVVTIPFVNGKPSKSYIDFATGFWIAGTTPAQVWGRPAGLLVAKDGSLLIADDAGGKVWRVAYTGK